MDASLPLAATDPLIVAVVGALLGGGVLSGVAVLLRAPKQGQLDVMNASKVIYDELRSELDQERKEKDDAQVGWRTCEAERSRLQGRLTAAEAENVFLRERISYVEDQVRRRERHYFEGDVMRRPGEDADGVNTD